MQRGIFHNSSMPSGLICPSLSGEIAPSQSAVEEIAELSREVWGVKTSIPHSQLRSPDSTRPSAVDGKIGNDAGEPHRGRRLIWRLPNQAPPRRTEVSKGWKDGIQTDRTAGPIYSRFFWSCLDGPA